MRISLSYKAVRSKFSNPKSSFDCRWDPDCFRRHSKQRKKEIFGFLGSQAKIQTIYLAKFVWKSLFLFLKAMYLIDAPSLYLLDTPLRLRLKKLFRNLKLNSTWIKKWLVYGDATKPLINFVSLKRSWEVDWNRKICCRFYGSTGFSALLAVLGVS